MRFNRAFVAVLALPFLMADDCGEDGTPAYVSPFCLQHPGMTCTTDIQCGNTTFCDGAERCMPGAAGADGCGCIGAPAPACGADQTCNEVGARCEACQTDADGDGHRDPACDGDDCDDHDANRFPGNPEVCDVAGHDEDCDAGTFGLVDADGDQFYSAACCNTDNAGMSHCGTDCDDTNPAIVPGAQKCVKNLSTTVLICQKDGTFTAAVDCGGTLSCIVQPNGLGVCE